MADTARSLLSRRHAASLLLGSMCIGLSACGGGAGPVIPVLPKLDVLPGLLALPPQTLISPSFQPLQLRSLTRLADGGFAIAWMASQAIDLAGPWQLLVQRFDREGLPLGGPRTLPGLITDSEAAATVLPDGSTLLAYREVLQPVPDHPTYHVFNLLVQRFDPQGQPVGDAVRAGGFTFDDRLMPPVSMRHPAVSNWLDGSYVVAWSQFQGLPDGVGVQSRITAQRFHPSGEPNGPPRLVAVSAFGPDFQLQALDYTGGYIVTEVANPQLPPRTQVHQVELWHPLDPDLLVPDAQLLSLALCGTILFTPRSGPDAPFHSMDWQHFTWEGQADGPPQPLPAGVTSEAFAGAAVIQPLPYPEQFLVLTQSLVARRPWAQRMDKHGRLLGAPFEFQAGDAYLALADTGVVSLRVVVTKIGLYSLEMQRYVEPPAAPAP